ncbi:MAG: roadblock/LC7 domain-containing protein [Candidatus Lokiarchaeota archaeon]|nr:roadblock/LC7 domain-containing protein [Candidatus Lokiarchaeota archaeon]
MPEENDFLGKLEAVLKRLLSNNPDITIATISSVEGLPIVSVIPRGSNETLISAMVATLLSLSEKAVMDMNIGEFTQLYIKGIDGYLLVFEAGTGVLAVSTTNDVKLGLIFFECEKAALEISEILRKED